MESTNDRKQQQLVKHEPLHVLSFSVLASFKSSWKSLWTHSSTLAVNTSWLKIRRRRAFVWILPKHLLRLRHWANPCNKMHSLVIEEFWWLKEAEFHSPLSRFLFITKMVQGMKTCDLIDIKTFTSFNASFIPENITFWCLAETVQLER